MVSKSDFIFLILILKIQMAFFQFYIIFWDLDGYLYHLGPKIPLYRGQKKLKKKNYKNI